MAEQKYGLLLTFVPATRCEVDESRGEDSVSVIETDLITRRPCKKAGIKLDKPL